jgi:hypothetical protein
MTLLNHSLWRRINHSIAQTKLNNLGDFCEGLLRFGSDRVLQAAIEFR